MKARFNFTISGFVIALIVVSMVVSGLGLFMSEIQIKYDHLNDYNETFSKYNMTNSLNTSTTSIRDSVETVDADPKWTDVLGGFLSSGLGAIKTAWSSVDLFEELINDMFNDIPGLHNFKIGTFLFMIVLIGIFIGVGILIFTKVRV